jgi:hypothetical protein
VGADKAVIGKIQRVPLREVWKHEALDFTTWLQGNIDVVSDVVNVPLDEAEREQSAGNFSVDLVARDSSGDPVVIENQLEKSDHDHLGKLLTYQDLYILQDREDWIPLYPFVSVHYCPRCRARETYFIDSWSGPGGVARLKSFERLHDETSPEIGEELTRWFDGGDV